MTSKVLSPVKNFGQYSPGLSWWEWSSVAPPVSGNTFYRKISGVASKQGVNGRYHIRLHLRRNGKPINETYSASDGTYKFEYVPNEPCYVVILDWPGADPKNAEIADWVSPVVM